MEGMTDKEYREHITKKLEALTGRAGDVAKKYLELKAAGYYNRSKPKAELDALLLEGCPKTTGELFQNGPYQIVEAILGRAWAEKASKIAESLHLYNYDRSSYRRSFRTREVEAYLPRIISLLELVYMPDGDFDLLAYLTAPRAKDAPRPGIENGMIANLVSLEIDEGNQAVIGAVKDICLSDNNTKLLDDSIIIGIFRSGNRELHLLLRDLLLAAKLQEGLRQAILEHADDGRLEAFILMLETIMENNLIRFSSTVRALDVWMGLGEAAEDSRQRVTEKMARLAHTYLTDDSARRAAEDSRDVMELYISLWAASVLEIADISPFIDKLMAGEKYQRLTALYFVRNAGYERFQTEAAMRHIGQEDMDVLAYVLANISINNGYYGKKEDFLERAQKASLLKDMEYRARLFARLSEILPQIPVEGHIVTGKPFDWCRMTLERSDMLRMLLSIAACEDGARNAELLALMPLSDSDSRACYLRVFLDGPQSQPEREYLFACLQDKSMGVRQQALNCIKKLELQEGEEESILKLLTLKTGDIRQGAVNLLLTLPEERLDRAARTLLSDKNVNMRLAGLDVLLRQVKEQKLPREAAVELTALMPKLTEQEKILLDELTAPSTEYNADNGFGLYDTDYMKKLSLTLPESPKGLADIFDVDLQRIKDLHAALRALITEHKDYTFTVEGYNGSTDDQVLGAVRYLRFPKRKERGERHLLDDFVLPEVWRGWLENNHVTYAELLFMWFTEHVENYSHVYSPSCADWANPIIEQHFRAQKVAAFAKDYGAEDYPALSMNLLKLMRWEFAEAERFNLAVGALLELMRTLPEDSWKKDVSKKPREGSITRLVSTKEVDFLMDAAKEATEDDTRFAEYMAICYEMGRLASMTYCGGYDVDIARGYALGLVPRDALLKLAFKDSGSLVGSYAGRPINRNKDLVEKYPILMETANEAAARIIEIELKRGDSPTEVSHLATRIRYHEGAETFVAILLALGKETFLRGGGYSRDTSKKNVLCRLIQACHPAEGDTAKTLKAAIEGRIGETRLLEAAMYSPSWLSLVSEVLGWKGLESAAWYFHAHINEGFSAEKETEVARYSPITPQEFVDGAFDVEWFKEAYKQLGKARFEILYDCAKYLTEGANHRRAQLFADANLGKLKLPELQKEIKDKRNKDKLLAYSLIPLKKNAEKDMLARYEFIQIFLKESKQFGAQRRDSEGKACAIALDNLARTAGFADSLRLSWRMEILKIEQISGYFSPKELDGAAVYVEVDQQGLAALVCEKGGKRLASVPAKLKKDKYLEACKEVVASLKEQQKRARAALENAMIRRDSFTYGEVTELMGHPVIAPLLKKLLFAHGGRVDSHEGFADLEDSAELRIAHAFDLYESGDWLKWQRFAFENQLLQPFKQIFRELYLVNEDEQREKNQSLRYAGHQIQAKKTVALLKGRGWTVDHEDGLQKVYYKENIIATMYAAADWFSPADTEEPTLEMVRFYDRKKRYEPLALDAIPPVIFSEIMRDVDLVVSVAHVGGVDPEASHSTVEMRAAIVRELLALLRVDNAEVRERHVFIKGALGEYTVHLGSGGVQMLGRGAVNILAVPSQHRGRVFLPFADEDPRTAEILSKVLLLAEDTGVKDPAILAQIG